MKAEKTELKKVERLDVLTAELTVELTVDKMADEWAFYLVVKLVV